MSSSRSRTIAIFGLVLTLWGCGEGDVARHQRELMDRDQRISSLQSDFADKTRELTVRQQENEAMRNEVKSLRQRVTELDKQSARAQATPEPPSSRGASDVDSGKLSLMGAKALAEFRATQLQERLDALRQDLDRKEQALKALSRDAAQKAQEVEAVQKRMEGLQSAEQTRSQELTAKLNQISAELSKRAEESERLKRDLSDKTQMLDALKNAVTDAGQLKANALAQVKQVSEALNEKERQLEEARQKTEAYRTELLSTQEDMERAQQEAEQCLQSAEKLKAELARQGEETTQLRTELAQVSQRLQTLESKHDDPSTARRSPLDRLLRGPSRQEQDTSDEEE
ncbi:MAG: hypothetical protein FJ118_16075 [Deltaproteobacteria bacterium]|nr:hypothetical protein [Deltaproteobacteria bacterium]